MYTGEQEQLRMSLNQFFGAILTNSKFEDPSLAKQSLIALVIEELLKFCKNEDETIDMIAAKPILRGTHYALEQRKFNIEEKLTEEGFSEDAIQDAIEDIHWIVSDLNKYISSLN